MRSALFGTLLTLLFAAGGAQAAEVGKPAPDFTVTDSNGKAHKLSECKGKWVVLEWLNHGCPYVRKHYDDEQTAALVCLVGLINAANRMAVITRQKGGSYQTGAMADFKA